MKSSHGKITPWKWMREASMLQALRIYSSHKEVWSETYSVYSVPSYLHLSNCSQDSDDSKAALLHESKCLNACNGILKSFQGDCESAITWVETLRWQIWPQLKLTLMRNGAHYSDVCFRHIRSKVNAFRCVYWFCTLRKFKAFKSTQLCCFVSGKRLKRVSEHNIQVKFHFLFHFQE